MIQFLWQGGHGSHGPRTQALVAVTPGAREGDIATTAASKVPGLHTLGFWGHGDAHKLCGKTPAEIHKIISDWKKLNPTLKTIEIITCNARHCVGGNPFANALKAKFGMMSGTRGLVVKALPTTVTGKNNAWSILLAETNFNSWCYVTAPGATDKLLMEASSLITFQKNATGGLVSYRGDICTRADETVRKNPQRAWTMNYGKLGTLRAHLGNV